LDLPLTIEDLTRLYRFALLLTGEDGAAQQILYDACAECAGRLHGYRSEEGKMACLVGNLRQKAKLVALAAEGRGITRAFGKLPEEERVALAGMYTGLLPTRALADALKLTLEEMGKVLKSARAGLERASLELGETGELGELGRPTVEKAL
jgi:DNA-directed RNA polymerase specialized sigma24 family protein